MPDSPATLPRDLIEEVGRARAVREVVRIGADEGRGSRWRTFRLALRVLFA